MTDELAAVLRRIVGDGVASAGYDLIGMEMDFYVRLGEDERIDFDSVSVERTDDPAALIRASCRARGGVPLGLAAEMVRHAWLADLRYEYFEAHDLAIGEREALFRCVTQASPQGMFVTARVLIAGTPTDDVP